MRWRHLRLSRKVCVLGLALLVLLAGLEGIARLYWWRIKKVPWQSLGTEAIWRTTYIEIASSGIDDVAPHHGDNTFDVLILGASVVHPSHGDIAARLRTRLEEEFGRPVRVVNFSYPGRTSADSQMKYARLEDRRFDLVLFYHGINDTFLNNCPPGEFRADYTHVRHIAQMRALLRHPEVGWFALPYTAWYLAINSAERCRLGTGIGKWGRWDMRYGGDLRTPPSFEANLEAVVDLAQRRGDRLLLATFAHHIPENYTLEAFQAHRLDYDFHLCPAELWGEPAHLRRALAAHNDAVRRVAARRGTLFVDIANRMPPGRLCFNDPCHLTGEGCRQFVELVVEAVAPRRHRSCTVQPL
jgi:hypothetical protein